MNVANALKHLYPNATPFTDYELRDDSDGQGVKIVKWNLGDMPRLEELQAASDAYDAAKAVEDSNAAIYAQLDELDKKLIRPLSEGETARVAEIVAQKQALRAQLVQE